MGWLGLSVFANPQIVPKIARGSKSQPQPPASQLFIGIRIRIKASDCYSCSVVGSRYGARYSLESMAFASSDRGPVKVSFGRILSSGPT